MAVVLKKPLNIPRGNTALLGGSIQLVWFILLEVTVIGGFIFHFFWEAKSQYALPYFVLLIPLAVDGYRNAVVLFRQPAVLRQVGKKAGVLALSGIVLMGLIGSGIVSAFRLIFLRQEDEETYAQEISSNTLEKVQEGTYYLFATDDRGNYYLKADPDGTEASLTSENTDVAIYTSELNNRVRISVDGTGEFLTVQEFDGSGESEIVLSKSLQPDEQQWSIHKGSAEDTITLVYGGAQALTFDTETGKVYLATYDGREEQQWHLEEVD